MKKSLFILSLALLLLNGCAYNVDTITEEPTQTSNVIEPINLIQVAAEAGLQLIESTEVQSITVDGVNPEQIGKIYNLGKDLSFAFVNQPNSWTALPETRTWEAEGNTAWSGLLIREFGDNWKPFLKISEEDFNPVSLVLEGKDLFLDIADDSGAGSGEGTLNRYVYSLEDSNFTPFYTWMNVGCTGYYIPETYKYEAFSCK